MIKRESYPARRRVIVSATPLMILRVVKTACFGSDAPVIATTIVASAVVVKVCRTVFGYMFSCWK